MPHPGRNNIYDATIRRMVKVALEAQEQEFVQNRGGDSDEQLLAYLQFCTALLGHTPWPREIVGGSVIEQRFGSWEMALAKAKLPKPAAQDKLTGFARYIEETERQKAAYRQKKAAKKTKGPAEGNGAKRETESLVCEHRVCTPPLYIPFQKLSNCPLDSFCPLNTASTALRWY